MSRCSSHDVAMERIAGVEICGCCMAECGIDGVEYRATQVLRGAEAALHGRAALRAATTAPPEFDGSTYGYVKYLTGSTDQEMAAIGFWPPNSPEHDSDALAMTDPAGT